MSAQSPKGAGAYGRDMSDENEEPFSAANNILADARARIWYRGGAVAGSAITLLVLLYSLHSVVGAFLKHITLIEKHLWNDVPELVAASPCSRPADALASPPASSAAVVHAPSAASTAVAHTTALPPSAASKSASGPAATAPKASDARAEMQESRKVYLDKGVKTIATSGVAIVAVLVIAATVLAITLVRATFALRLTDGEGKEEQDEGLPLPSWEMAKEVKDTVAEAVKEVLGKKGG